MTGEEAGQGPAASMTSAAEGNAAANRVIFYSQAYTALMEQAHAAMPGESVGVLLGDTQPAPAGKLWVTVTDLAPIKLAINDTAEARLDRVRNLIERLGRQESSKKVVGWFYADPGTGLFPPRLPLTEVQHAIPESATLFLLANPATSQGAFFWWNGTSYAEADGFYEAVPDESFSPIVTWDGEVRGAKAWFGGLLAVAAHSTVDESGPPAGMLLGPPGNDAQAGADYSPPVYVEVITEEPVEYVPPEASTPPAQSEAPISTDTQPYPIDPQPKMSDVADGADVAEDAPAREGPSTNYLGAMTSKLATDEALPEPSGSPGEPGDTSGTLGTLGTLDQSQTGPLGTVLAAMPDDETPTGQPVDEAVTGEHITTGETETQNEPTTLAQVRASTVLAPVTRSSVRPVMRGRNWREMVLTVLGLVAVAVMLILLLGGLPAPQNSPQPSSPPASTGSSLNRDNAQAGNALPGATVTITATIAPQPPLTTSP